MDFKIQHDWNQICLNGFSKICFFLLHNKRKFMNFPLRSLPIFQDVNNSITAQAALRFWKVNALLRITNYSTHLKAISVFIVFWKGFYLFFKIFF
jgi:hypothetical protein